MLIIPQLQRHFTSLSKLSKCCCGNEQKVKTFWLSVIALNNRKRETNCILECDFVFLQSNSSFITFRAMEGSE